MKKLQEKLADAALRMDKVILLAGALVDAESPCDELVEFIDYEADPKTLKRLFSGFKDQDDLQRQLCEWLCESGEQGYLVQFATPVMRRIGKTARSFSWGHYYTQWEYGETLDEVVSKGLTWAAGIRAEEDQKFKAEHAKGGSK